MTGMTSQVALRGVIFDLGGTLIYNHPEPELDRERRQCKAIAAFAATEFGCTTPESLADRLLTLRNEGGKLAAQDLVERLARDTIAQALREYGIQVNERVLDLAERLLFEPDRRDRRLYPGAHELLDMLRCQGLRMALITNWSSHQIVTDVTLVLGIHEYFAPLVSSAAFGRLKPHLSIFRYVLETWQLSAEHVIMVGDSLHTDIAGAAALGMRSILVEIEPNPDNAKFAASVLPTHRVGRLLGIPSLLMPPS